MLLGGNARPNASAMSADLQKHPGWTVVPCSHEDRCNSFLSRPLVVLHASPVPPGRGQHEAESTTNMTVTKPLTADEAAEYLGLPKATLMQWRSRYPGYGPNATIVGGSLRYRVNELERWLDAHTEGHETFDADTAELPSARVSTPTGSLSRKSRPRKVA